MKLVDTGNPLAPGTTLDPITGLPIGTITVPTPSPNAFGPGLGGNQATDYQAMISALLPQIASLYQASNADPARQQQLRNILDALVVGNPNLLQALSDAQAVIANPNGPITGGTTYGGQIPGTPINQPVVPVPGSNNFIPGGQPSGPVYVAPAPGGGVTMSPTPITTPTPSTPSKTYTASDGKVFDTEAGMLVYEQQLKDAKAAKDLATASRQSAYDLLYAEFNKYGLGSLVEGIKNLIQDPTVSPAEFAIRLQNTPEYQARFSANKDRISAGLRPLTPAEYLGLEDQYQNIMRNYGLPASYWAKDATGKQAGFDKFLAGDVSAAELEDRIATAQKRVINAEPTVTQALKQFYPDISNGDILAYTLDPKNGLENIKRKVTAAEIGGAALSQGLATSATGAEGLAGYGVTKQQAQQGYQTIGELLPTATKLGDIYSKQGLGAYNQGTAEAEVFGTAGAATAAQKRKKLTQLEQASFSGSAGTSQGALGRERAGSF